MTTEICQSCGGTVLRIVYGMPVPNLMAAASEGDVALGGCILWPDNPTWKCRDCENSGGDDPTLGD
ncbi:MAG: hypothetical protein LH624_18490 [Cryobacterium sp.]|nr:hypothetical protein [Cryobacterium sp.]